jgi:predicted negative regulator of RcsB-dependent stress response
MSTEVQETSSRELELLAWFETNKKRIVWGLVLATLAIGAYFLFTQMSQEKEAAASRALLDVRMNAVAGTPTAADFLKVASAHSGTEAARQAELLAACAYFTEGKFAEAQMQFEKFLQQFGGSTFAATAAYGIATALEAQGKTDEALQAYQRVTAQFPNDGVANQAKLGQARVLESKGKFADALVIYRDFERPATPTVWSSEANLRREALLKQHPELAVAPDAPATNAPAAPAPAAK